MRNIHPGVNYISPGRQSRCAAWSSALGEKVMHLAKSTICIDGGYENDDGDDDGGGYGQDLR